MQTPGRTGLYIAAANMYKEWVLALCQINRTKLQENKLVYRMTIPHIKPKKAKMVPLYKMGCPLKIQPQNNLIFCSCFFCFCLDFTLFSHFTAGY